MEYAYILRDEIKQSKGSAFFKYGSREMEIGAIDALNGTLVIKGVKYDYDLGQSYFSEITKE